MVIYAIIPINVIIFSAWKISRKTYDIFSIMPTVRVTANIEIKASGIASAIFLLGVEHINSADAEKSIA